ncbi:MAG: proline--tRNA ligase [Anaeroplasmataceae bacterium]
MKASKMLISTLKEAPVDAKIVSHSLLIRSGMIRGIVAGVYNFMPLGLRVLHKIENVIRDEMDKSGALEILSSAVQPKELWVESHRWEKYGPELFRFKDRHEREFCLGPTHEEVFTDIVRNTVKSSKNLPLNIYQIQTKYRDEARPRFGLMRGREFIMKDAYSFDKDQAGLEVSYNEMYETYSKIFTRLGLDYRVVLADTGAIGGNGSHQFMALSDIGESDIVYCDSLDYAADVEKAEAICTLSDDSKMGDMEEVYTPNSRTIEEVASFLNVDPKKTVKTILYKDTENNRVVAALVRGDREVNEIKLVNAMDTAEAFLTFANDEDIKKLNTIHGFLGPVGLNCELFIDKEVSEMKNIIVGANKEGYHLMNVNYGRDFTGTVLDLRKAVAGDLCPCCGKAMKIDRGIEIGQIFKLQTKYSEPMKCSYVNENGENVPMVMGCYGIGVTRTLQAIVEQNNDEFGIKWPLIVAPYHAVVVPVKYEDEIQKELSDKIYKELLDNTKVETILDDRKAGLGFKLKDWELIGIPYAIVVGKRASEGIVELKNRYTNEKEELSYTDAINKINEAIKNIK